MTNLHLHTVWSWSFKQEMRWGGERNEDDGFKTERIYFAELWALLIVLAIGHSPTLSLL